MSRPSCVDRFRPSGVPGAQSTSNAGALSCALRAMDGRHRASPGVPPEIAELGRTGSSPKQFMTRHGALDVVVAPAGGHGFRELAHRSVRVDLGQGSCCAAQRSRT